MHYVLCMALGHVAGLVTVLEGRPQQREDPKSHPAQAEPHYNGQ